MLLVAEHRLSAHSLIEIDLVAIKLRPLDTCKSCLATDTHSASSTHTSTIDHQCIERHGRLERVGLGRLSHKFHHNHRADSHTLIIVLTLIINQILDNIRNKPLCALRTIIGGDIEI